MKPKINILIVVLLLAVSCRSGREVVSVTSDSTYSRARVDSSHFTRAVFLPDSASIEALLRCDSLGNVYIAQIERLKTGNRLKPEIIIKNNYLKATCKADSMLIYQLFASRLNVAGEVKKEETKEVIKPPGKPWFWLTGILPWIGYLPLLLLIAYIIYRLIKIFR